MEHVQGGALRQKNSVKTRQMVMLLWSVNWDDQTTCAGNEFSFIGTLIKSLYLLIEILKVPNKHGPTGARVEYVNKR